MAITASAAGPKVVRSLSSLLSYNDVTFTLDGSATSLAVAGTAHGGPSGVEPVSVRAERRGGDSTDSVAFHLNVTNFDTTNDEVDYTLYLSAAGTNTKTVILRIFFEFDSQASGGIS